jgi:hypothetical protein
VAPAGGRGELVAAPSRDGASLAKVAAAVVAGQQATIAQHGRLAVIGHDNHVGERDS